MTQTILHSLERLGIDLRVSAIFDADWYRKAYADVGECADPVQHFIDVGWAQRRAPNAFMDPVWYLHQYPDVRDAGADPLLHYMQSGWREGREPGPWFSTSRYCIANPDVRDAGINPLLHYLQSGRAKGRAPLGLSSLDPGTVDVCIRVEDIGTPIIVQWLAELVLHDRSVRLHVVHPRSLLHRAVLALVGAGLGRWHRVRAPIISINGAGLTPRVAKVAGRGLIVVFDSAAAALAMRPGLRNALSLATVATPSTRIAALLTSVTDSSPLRYAEPMSGAYLQAGLSERSIPVIWRCPSPLSLHGRPPLAIRERRAIAHRLAPFGLRIVGDAGWRDQRRGVAAALDVRNDWASLRCARECYGDAKIALVTPPPGQEREIPADLLIAIASGTLAVAPYTMAKALFDRFGDDVPVPLYKDVGEAVLIVEHYLREEEERVALVDRGAVRLLSQPGYSAVVGDLLHSMTIGQ